MPWLIAARWPRRGLRRTIQRDTGGAVADIAAGRATLQQPRRNRLRHPRRHRHHRLGVPAGGTGGADLEHPPDAKHHPRGARSLRGDAADRLRQPRASHTGSRARSTEQAGGIVQRHDGSARAVEICRAARQDSRNALNLHLGRAPQPADLRKYAGREVRDVLQRRLRRSARPSGLHQRRPPAADPRARGEDDPARSHRHGHRPAARFLLRAARRRNSSTRSGSPRC